MNHILGSQRLPTPSKLAFAVCTALAITQPTIVASAFANTAEDQKIETIEVTATKRSQNIQSTPVAVQALNGEALREQNISNFDDFARYVPNITLGGRGPGQSDVFIRGMAIQPITVMLSGAQGTMPNVALYIDEQPVTAPGRNLDLYATDLERIEVLPGPQGTLFGASSQAGTIRYITNKPTSDFEAGFSTRLESTKHGEMSTSAEGFINIPLNDDLSFRAAMYSVNRGGYIDNVAGTFSTDPAINSASVLDLGPDATYESASNLALAEDDFNDSFYQGGRFGLKYFINDSWSLLLQHTTQSLGADGVFDYDPEVGDLQVERYFPDSLRDDVDLTSLVVEGKLGALDVVYAGAFLDREVEQSIDYTGYNNSGGYIAYYTCTYTNPDYVVNYNISPEFITENRECKDPTKGFKGQQEHSRITHELRFSTDFTDRLSMTAGIYYDDVEIKTQDDYVYVAMEELGFAPNAPISTANSINPNTRPVGVSFFNDITRSEEQIAVFGEATYAITDKLAATLGLRWYDIESDYTGSSNFADGIFQGSMNTDRGRDYDSSGGHSTEPLQEDGVIPKFSLAYQATDSVLYYATYSEGFRPGGFNRGGGVTSANPDFPTVGITYATDDVTNYEFGWKSLLLDQSLRFNGNVYYIDWSNMQTSRFDPQNVSILTFIENAADSKIQGIETDFEYIATDNLTIYGAFSFNKTELTATRAQVIEMAPVGSELPVTPAVQGNVRVRYDWEYQGMDMDWQLALQHASKSYSSIVASEREEQAGYQLLNANFGISKDAWRVKFYIDNVTDERATLFINDQDDIKRISTNRPRTIGMSVNYTYY
jgi:iron complex outermembrane receptor protein